MHKKKISKKREFSLDDMPEINITNRDGITEWSCEDTFMNEQKVGAALLECLVDNDTETFIEILDSYLRVNRLQVAKKTNLSRSTIQKVFSKNGNPTLKTLAKIVHEAALKR